MNIAEIIIAVGWFGCGLMAVGVVALVAKMLVVDPLRWRRRDAEDLARLSPKPEPAKVAPKAVTK